MGEASDVQPRRVEIDGVRYVRASEAALAQASPASVAVSRAVAAKLLRMLWLYPNYNVASRGPVGLIHDALKEVAPGAQSMLADGHDPHDVLRVCFPDELGE